MPSQTASTSILGGILLTLAAGMIFSSMDAVAKSLTGTLPVMQVVWGRYVFHTILVGGVLAARSGGFGYLRSRHPLLQFLRGMCLLSSTLLMYMAIARVPLADATAVLFFSPVFVTLLSVLVLKETIGIHRITAVVAGFVGVLLVVRPELGRTDPWLLLPLAAVVSNSVYLMMTRHLAHAENPAVTQFNTTAAGMVIMCLVVLPVWQTPAPSQWMLMFVMGAFGALGHTVLVKAFSFAPASLLSPFLYSQVMFSALLSIFWFGDPMHPLTLAGTAILIASGIYIWWRENRKRL